MSQCSYVSNWKPDCAEEQPDLLRDSKRAAGEGARADWEGDIFAILWSVIEDWWSVVEYWWSVIEDAEIDGFGLDERLQDLGKVKMTVMGIIFVLLNQSFW